MHLTSSVSKIITGISDAACIGQGKLKRFFFRYIYDSSGLILLAEPDTVGLFFFVNINPSFVAAAETVMYCIYMPFDLYFCTKRQVICGDGFTFYRFIAGRCNTVGLAALVKACGISGYLLGVNPFDQPGVEAYKKNMFALLGKPGYEDMKQDLEDRLSK